ncbi:MAG: hypothetical protein BWY13_00841 [Euryarchaeota archaeon ADurb.Bin190]|nr:MAG: hypothetical protein BWY13_00841 [Euryarchaeota archaeon ADurb.Bin190]
MLPDSTATIGVQRPSSNWDSRDIPPTTTTTKIMSLTGPGRGKLSNHSVILINQLYPLVGAYTPFDAAHIWQSDRTGS